MPRDGLSWRKAAAQHGIFFPVSRSKQAWDIIIMACILYSAVLMPFRFCFAVEAHGMMLVLEAVISLLFFVDFFACFNTAYEDQERWVIARSRIAGRYLRTWFWIDAPGSLLPVEVFQLASEISRALYYDQYSSDSPGTLEQFNEAMRMLRLIRLVRLLRLAKVSYLLDGFNQTFIRVFAMLESATSVNVLLMTSIFNLFVIMAYTIHVFACIWFYIGAATSNGGTQRSWITEFDDSFVVNADPHDQYIVAALWSTGMITGLNSDVVPVNQTERVYAITVHLIAAFVISYVIGGIGDALAASRRQQERSTTMMEGMKAYLRFHGVPSDLSTGIIEYTSYYLEQTQDPDHFDMVELVLTPSLKRALNEQILSTTVNQTLLAPFNNEFKNQVYRRLQPIVLDRNDVVIEKRAPDRYVYFLRRPEQRINALSENGDILYTCCGSSDGRQERAGQDSDSSSGAEADSRSADLIHIFGEENIFFSSCPVEYQAETRCAIFALAVADLYDVARGFLQLGSAADTADDLERDSFIRGKRKELGQAFLAKNLIGSTLTKLKRRVFAMRQRLHSPLPLEEEAKEHESRAAMRIQIAIIYGVCMRARRKIEAMEADELTMAVFDVGETDLWNMFTAGAQQRQPSLRAEYAPAPAAPSPSPPPSTLPEKPAAGPAEKAPPRTMGISFSSKRSGGDDGAAPVGGSFAIGKQSSSVEQLIRSGFENMERRQDKLSNMVRAMKDEVDALKLVGARPPAGRRTSGAGASALHFRGEMSTNDRARARRSDHRDRAYQA